jgi:hypothetical protein
MVINMENEFVYIMWSNTPDEVRLHGIFHSDKIKDYQQQRNSIGAKIMCVPLNKFVDSGVIL